MHQAVLHNKLEGQWRPFFDSEGAQNIEQMLSNAGGAVEFIQEVAAHTEMAELVAPRPWQRSDANLA